MRITVLFVQGTSVPNLTWLKTYSVTILTKRVHWHCRVIELKALRHDGCSYNQGLTGMVHEDCRRDKVAFLGAMVKWVPRVKHACHHTNWDAVGQWFPSRPDFVTQGAFVMSEDNILCCRKWGRGARIFLVSSGKRSRMLLNILLCTGHPLVPSQNKESFSLNAKMERLYCKPTLR